MKQYFFVTLLSLGAQIRGAQTRYTVVNFGLYQALEDIIFIYSDVRKYYNDEIMLNTKTHSHTDEKLFASFYIENVFAKYFAKCCHLFT